MGFSHFLQALKWCTVPRFVFEVYFLYWHWREGLKVAPDTYQGKKMKKALIIAILLFSYISTTYSQTDIKKNLVGTKWENVEGTIIYGDGTTKAVNRGKLLGAIKFHSNGMASIEYVDIDEKLQKTIKVNDIFWDLSKDWIVLSEARMPIRSKHSVEMFKIAEFSEREMTLQIADFYEGKIMIVNLLFKKLY